MVGWAWSNPRSPSQQQQHPSRPRLLTLPSCLSWISMFQFFIPSISDITSLVWWPVVVRLMTVFSFYSYTVQFLLQSCLYYLETPQKTFVIIKLRSLNARYTAPCCPDAVTASGISPSLVDSTLVMFAPVVAMKYGRAVAGRTREATPHMNPA